MAEYPADKRDYRRKTPDDVTEVKHNSAKSKVKTIASSSKAWATGNPDRRGSQIKNKQYRKRISEKSRKMATQMIEGADPKEIRATQKEAMDIYNESMQEVSEIDRAMVSEMLRNPSAKATEKLPVEVVNRAWVSAISFYTKNDGILEEQRTRQDRLTPNMLSAKNVRRDAELILLKTKNQQQVWGFDTTEKDIAKKYKDVPPLSDDPIEIKNIAALMPQNPSYLPGDIAQLHTYMIVNLEAGNKPDAISLAKVYLRYRRSLISQMKQIL